MNRARTGTRYSLCRYLGDPPAGPGIGDTHRRSTTCRTPRCGLAEVTTIRRWVVLAVMLAIATEGCTAATGPPSVADVQEAMCAGSDEWCTWTVLSVDSTTSGGSEGIRFSDIDFTMTHNEPPDETCKWLKQRFVVNDEGVWTATAPQAPPDTCQIV